MIGFVLAITGLLLFLYGFIVVLKLSRLYGYKSVKTDVKASSIREIKRREVYVEMTYFIPEITYQYEINGQVFENDMVFPKIKYIMFDDRWRAQKFVERLAKYEVTFVDEDQPRNSILYRPEKITIALKDGGVLAAGILLLAISLSFYFW